MSLRVTRRSSRLDREVKIGRDAFETTTTSKTLAGVGLLEDPVQLDCCRSSPPAPVIASVPTASTRHLPKHVTYLRPAARSPSQRNKYMTGARRRQYRTRGLSARHPAFATGAASEKKGRQERQEQNEQQKTTASTHIDCWRRCIISTRILFFFCATNNTSRHDLFSVTFATCTLQTEWWWPRYQQRR